MWQTCAPQRRVLAVVHDVTAATRLLDVPDLIAEEVRIEVDLTDPGNQSISRWNGGISRLTRGSPHFLGERDDRRPRSRDLRDEVPDDVVAGLATIRDRRRRPDAVDLHGARLPGADLRGAVGLTGGQLRRARTDPTTGLPPGIGP